MSSASKTERLLNLLIMLLVQRHYVSKERIREILYADAPSTDAFEKTFERDKEELRSLGVPIEVGQMDAYFDDEPGYRIRADEFALPEISLESDEASVVGPGHPGLGARPAGRGHHRRRRQADRGRPRPRPRRPRHRPAAAERRRAVVRRVLGGHPGAPAGRPSTTADPGTTQPLTRHLEPWGVVRFSGRWYVVGPGHRPRRGAGVPALARRRRGDDDAGRPGSFVVPAGHRRPRRPPAGSRRPTPAEEAVVLVRPGAGAVLRRDGDQRRARRRRPRRARPRGTGCGSPAAPRPTSCSPSAPTSTSRRRPRCATRSSRDCARPWGRPS